MKKLLSILLLACMVCCTFCLGACSDQTTVTMVTIVYSDTQILPENEELLMVLAPCQTGQNLDIVQMDGVVLPVPNADFGGEQTKMSHGDLVVFTFKKGIYIRQETNPKFFIDEPTSCQILYRGLGLLSADGGYRMEIPTAITGEAKKGETLCFYSVKQATKPFYSAIIEDCSAEKLTVFIPHDKMQKAFSSFHFGTVCTGENNG